MPAAAIVKFGSTSTTLLVATRIENPEIREQRLFDLFDPRGRQQVMTWATYLKQQAEIARAIPLAAGGEALRVNPELERRLMNIFPHWWHLTAETEGRLAWMAVKSQHHEADVVIDIGGGSTEIISQSHVWSLPLGAARRGTATAWPDLSSFHHPVFIGGTAVSLKMWTGRSPQSRRDISTLQEALNNQSESLPVWDAGRKKILPQGLALMLDILDHAGWRQFEVSQRGLTEGLWLAASLGRGARS